MAGERKENMRRSLRVELGLERLDEAQLDGLRREFAAGCACRDKYFWS